jgi:hypothetical protein
VANLALTGGNAGLILRNSPAVGFLVRQRAPIKLGQPQMDEVGGDVMTALGIAPPKDARTDILAELQLERY